MFKVNFEDEGEDGFVFTISGLIKCKMIIYCPDKGDIGEWQYVSKGMRGNVQFEDGSSDFSIFSDGKNVEFQVCSANGENDILIEVPFENCRDALNMSLQARKSLKK